MNFDHYDDPTREYEMIWALFQGKEEEKEVPKKNKEGITVKILKFLFGSGGGPRDNYPEPPDEYGEKRRFHRHVYHPSPRHPVITPHSGDISDERESQSKRLGSADFSNPNLTPGSFCQTLCSVVVAITLAAVVMLITSASTCIHTIKSIMSEDCNFDDSLHHL